MKKSWQRYLRSMALAGVLGTVLSFGAVPVPHASANVWGAVIGAVQGGVVYSQIDKELRYYNNTEEGRQKLLASYKKKYGVNSDSYLNGQLDSMMDEMTRGIRAVDPTIDKKPYLYFINNEKSFNAFCSMGHVMSVNTGLYSMTTVPDELAVVLLHEMGHGQKDHVVKSVRKKAGVAVGAMVLSGAAGSSVADAVLDIAVNQIDSVQITKPNEWAADNLALTYLLNTNYNPGASAAMWQRVMEKMKSSSKNFAGEIFSPSDHPTDQQRRDNYSKRLTDLSGGNVKVKDGVVYVSDKKFVKPAATSAMSSPERSYFIMGNLVAAYRTNQNAKDATVSGRTVLLGNQPIIECTQGDPEPQALATWLNQIKSSKPIVVPDRELKIQKQAAAT
ncbi:MAG: Peptidase-M48 domain-containing protein [Succiniclasticum sp.]|jgi:beta-barrel assembly-enhancing protease